MRSFFKFISIILHPVFIPVYLMAITFTIPTLTIQILNPLMRLVIIGLLIINNVVLPIFSLFVLKSQEQIKSFQMESAAERKTPYILLFIYYSITAYIYLQTSYLDPALRFIPMAAAATILALFFLNRYFKISAHLASFGSAFAYIILLHFYFDINSVFFLIGITFFAGLTASARLYLKAHDEVEVYAGFFVGLIMTFFVGSFYLF